MFLISQCATATCPIVHCCAQVSFCQQQLQLLIERFFENFKKIGQSNLIPAKVRSRIFIAQRNLDSILQRTSQECKSKYSCRVCIIRYYTLTRIPAQPTAWLTVRTLSSRIAVIRTLQGSEMTFISENLAQILRAKCIRTPISVSAVGGIHVATFQHVTHIFISSRNSDAPSLSTIVLIIKLLTSYTPTKRASLIISRPITTLTTNDTSQTILSGKCALSRVLTYPLLALPCSQKNFIVSGISRNSHDKFISHRTISSVKSIFAQLILATLTNGMLCGYHSKRVLRLIGKSRFREKNVKFITPQISRHESKVAKEYSEFMSNYQRLEHMRPAPIAHGVIRESSTTRLRVVFNASSVTSNGISLTNHLNADINTFFHPILRKCIARFVSICVT
ncbi:hypothetical protein ACFW04_012169 [Cataglyphis niger]